MYDIIVDMNTASIEHAQRRAFTLDEAAAICGVSYHTLYRAICRGNLRVLRGFGRMMVSDKELDRFLGKTADYKPRKRRKRENVCSKDRGADRGAGFIHLQSDSLLTEQQEGCA
jgi:hypothetical protein